MPRFAQIDENGLVLQVIVADQDFINTEKLGDPATFVETEKHTKNKQRKNYAAKGFSYLKDDDIFVPPKPSRHPSFVIDKNTGTWKPPKTPPELPQQAPFAWGWDEETQDWIKVDRDTYDGYVII